MTVDADHGTIESYKRGCHCDACKKANTTWMKGYRAGQKEREEAEGWTAKQRGESVTKIAIDDEGRTDFTDYDEEKVFSRATDSQGQSIELRVRVPVFVGREIDELVQSKRSLYRIRSDFARDAIYHHLKRRRDQAGKPPSREEEAWYAVIAAEDREVKFIDQRRTVERLYEQAMEARRLDDMKVLEKVLHDAERMMEGAVNKSIRQEADRLLQQFS